MVKHIFHVVKNLTFYYLHIIFLYIFYRTFYYLHFLADISDLKRKTNWYISSLQRFATYSFECTWLADKKTSVFSDSFNKYSWWTHWQIHLAFLLKFNYHSNQRSNLRTLFILIKIYNCYTPSHSRIHNIDWNVFKIAVFNQ